MTFDGRHDADRAWDGARPLAGVRGSRRARRSRTVEVDPDRVLLLDVNYTEQFVDARGRARRRPQQVGAALADLGAGTAADLCLLRLTPAARRRVRRLGAFLEGWRRVFARPRCRFGVLAATFLLALPLGVVAARIDRERISGSSLEADARGSRMERRLGRRIRRAGAGRSAGRSRYEILGFGGTLAIVSDFLDSEPLNPALAIAAAASTSRCGCSCPAASSIGSRADGRSGPARSFRRAACTSCASCGWPSLIGAAYWALFRWLHPWLFGTLYNGLRAT